MSSRVAVIGGGLAGITAALKCADAGRQVLLLESRNKLGGLTHSFERGGLLVDNGQHVFLRCCKAYLGLLERLGVTELVTVQPRLEIPIRVPGRDRTIRLTRNSLPAPLHLSRSLLGYAALTPTDRLRVIRGALGLRAVDLADASVDEQNFETWLRAHGQNSATIAALWDLFTVATLNIPAAQASLALAAKVFQTGLFTDTAAGDIGWSNVGLQQLHGDAALDKLRAAGVEVRTNAKVDLVKQDRPGWLIGERDGTLSAVDQVVLATPPDTAEKLLPQGSIDLDAGWSAQLGSSPIVNAHLVFDKRVLETLFVAGVASPVQWIFDRTSPSGLSDGQYLAISMSAADEIIDLTTAEIRARLMPALIELLPDAGATSVRDFFVTRERHATFRGRPGTAKFRPPSTTRLPGLVLAGAWTATGWPATMESAVLSGEAAASTLLGSSFTGQQKGSVAA